jgi:hypothetical protein
MAAPRPGSFAPVQFGNPKQPPMRPSRPLPTIIAWALMAIPWSRSTAQQSGTAYNDPPDDGFSAQIVVNEPGLAGCTDHHFSTVPYDWPENAPANDSQDLPYYYSLPGNPNTPFHLHVVVFYPKTIPAQWGGGPNGGWPFVSWQAGMSGQYWPYVATNANTTDLGANARYEADLEIQHHAGDAWSTNGERHVTLNCLAGGYQVGSIRFNAFMVGTNYQLLGHFTAPQTPTYILHDPPGDASYMQIQSGHEYCYGETFSTTDENEVSGYAKVKVGTDVSFFGTEVSIGVTAGISASRTETDAVNKEYKTCLSTNSTWTTNAVGARGDDVFIGNGVRYAYGVAKIITRTGCGVVSKTARFWMTPVSSELGFTSTFSGIKNTLLPQAQAAADALIPGSMEWKQARNQVDVWKQVLAMDSTIKANALAQGNPSVQIFDGGTSSNFDQTITTSATQSIDMKVVLEGSVSAEFAVDIGGSGVEAGGEITVRHEVGRGSSQSNTTTTTHTVHFQDDDLDDHFEVNIYKDPVYGVPVFGELDEASNTSCPYEGGYQLDQPHLTVGGGVHMDQNEVPVGTSAIFPVVACNYSDSSRTYVLSVNAGTNGNGALVSGLGGVNQNNSVTITLDPGECLSGNIYISAPVPQAVDFADLEIDLTDACGGEIVSSITVSAHFGVGNVASYCIPSSANGPSGGDWVDGVQIGSINNTSSGGVSGAAYTDYTGQFSTALSRNSQQLLTITSGDYGGDVYAAWIDYDHNGSFDASEKLGEFGSTGSHTAQNISFIVPLSATLGATRLRVRDSWPFESGDPNPLDPCYNYIWGETEDYAVTIDANTPHDCLNVANGTALPGTTCDDGNAATGNDTWSANCICAGQPMDCAGVPNGQAGPGTSCDDGNPNTTGDTYGNDCVCAGALVDCTGIPGGSNLPGVACDDGDPDTGDDVYGNDCFCVGALIDCMGLPGGIALPGAACDDGNPLSSEDTYTVDCLCVGTLVNDCQGVPGGAAQPGTPCDDGDQNTGNDLFGADCLCAGQPLDCNGIPGGGWLPGASCDDFNAETIDDVIQANCICLGTLQGDDCLGVPGGTAQPGTACDDGDATTGEDVFNAFCTCAGQLIDCNGVAGGFALPGGPCDDGFDFTGNDMYDAGCSCSGLIIDCVGVPGGSLHPGSACDDGDPNTGNDVYNASCICAGTLETDCAGVPGGTAQPGTDCDDGNANTGNDTWSANCQCLGLPYDCAGVPGGTAGTGTACDDENDCTSGDIWSLDCTCEGVAVEISGISGNGAIDVSTTNTYYVTPVAGATAYSWTLPNGWSSQNTSAFVLVATAGENAGTVQLCVDAFVGTCVVSSCMDVQVFSGNGVATAAPASDDWFTVQPNPSNGIFRITPSDNAKEPVRISVHDGIGRNVIAPFTLSLERSFPLDMGNVAPGAYYLLATREGHQQVVKLVVQH